jgi:hypothetical protein
MDLIVIEEEADSHAPSTPPVRTLLKGLVVGLAAAR